MAYGSKYHIIHKTKKGATSQTVRIELLERDFTGTSTEKKGAGEIYGYGYDGGDPKKMWDGIIQKAFIRMELYIESTSDFTILDDIIAGDEKKYQLRVLIDGVEKLTTFAIPDLITYPEDIKTSATIIGKELSQLEGEMYENNSAISYKRYAAGLADLLNSTGLSLPLYIYDDWTASNLDSTDDYFNQAYFDKFQLQDFSSYSEGTWGQITKFEALKNLIPKGYLLRQWEGKWHLFDLAHLAKDGGVVTRYEYDSAGTKTGKTTGVDLRSTVDRDTRFLLASSTNEPFPGLKRVRLDYNHKTSIQHILFENEYVHEASGTTSSESLKVSDGTQRAVKISGQVEVTTDTNPGTQRQGEAKLIISVGDYELALSDGSWGLNTGVQSVSVSGSDTTLTGTFSVAFSEDIPTDIDESELTVELRWATVSGENVTKVRWHNLSCSLTNGGAVSNDATFKYELERSGDYSMEAKVEEIIFGQGPNTYSNGAIRYFAAGATYDQLTVFKHIGGTGYDYHEFLMKNVLNMQRFFTKSLQADLWAYYEPINVLVYDSKNFLFLNGEITGRDSEWTGTIVELTWNTDANDTLIERFEVGSGDAGGVAPPSSGNSSKLNDLTDVAISSPATRHVPVYDGSVFTNRALEAADIQSGTFADGRIAQSNVTQHESALALDGSQITSGTIDDARLPSTMTGKTFTGGITVQQGGTDRFLVRTSNGAIDLKDQTYAWEQMFVFDSASQTYMRIETPSTYGKIDMTGGEKLILQESGGYIGLGHFDPTSLIHGEDTFAAGTSFNAMAQYVGFQSGTPVNGFKVGIGLGASHDGGDNRPGTRIYDYIVGGAGTTGDLHGLGIQVRDDDTWREVLTIDNNGLIRGSDFILT